MANTLKFGNGEWYGKKDTILAYNDENSNYKPLPFNFSRASSATVINKDGLIETVGSGQPRIDYKDDSEGALKLEPQRLNYVTQSETFTGYWGLQGASLIADNNVKNPTGNTFSNILNTTTTGTFKSINKNESSAWDSKTLTVSCFAKKITNDYIYFYNIGSTSGVNGTWFNINDGTLGVSGGAWSNEKIENYGNGWYRCSAKITFGTDTNYIYINNSIGNNNSSSNAGDQTYIWGTQIEEGSYATSYIPTQGSAVTRLVDVCSQTTPDGVIGQTEGTMYAEYYFDATIDNNGGSDRGIVSISNTLSNYIKIVHYGNGSLSYNRKIYLYSIVGGSNVATIISGQYSSGLMKVACGYKNNDYVLYVNGVQIGTDTSASVPTCSLFKLGKLASNINTSTPINQTKLYNTRLSNSELQALTS